MIKEINPPGEKTDLTGKHFAVIVSDYNEMITDKLRDGAIETLREHKIPDKQIELVRVPGAWELALGAKHAVSTNRYAGIVCLGAVIRGETSHDQHISRFVSQALGQLSLDAGIPIAFGLLTCNTFEQAHDRSGGKVGNKGNEAALAMLAMVDLYEKF